MPSRLDDALSRPAVHAALLVACVGILSLLVRHFWIPLDDGTLAQSAERVLRGQLPHRDFGDPYTGLNAVVGALAFRVFGVRLLSLRIPLVVGFALWLPALWLLARRFLAPAATVAAVLLAAVLSVPAYPAAMPTWFGLFAVTWGLWFLLRALDGAGRRWLVAAGIAAGVSVLFKVTGLYFLAAAYLSVAWRRVDGAPSMRATAVMGVLLFLALLGRLVLPGAGPSGFYHFFLPSLALGLLLVLRAWRLRRRWGSSSAVPALLGDGVALTLGALVPVALFLLPYAASGAVGTWLREVFLLPGRRFVSAASPPGAAWTVVPGMLAVAAAALSRRLQGAAGRRTALALAAALAVGLALDDRTGGAVMAWLWYSARAWIPALAVWAAVRLAFTPGGGATFAVVATAALWALVQFPYAAPAYFFYVAPLGVLATAAVLSEDRGKEGERDGMRRRPPPGPALGAEGLAPARGVAHAGPIVALLAALYAYLGAGYATGVTLSATTRLEPERGGLLVSASDARVYDRLVETVRSHAGGGGLWAGPDAPEVYFLTGIPNPGPTLYEFLASAPPTAGRLSALFQRADVRVAVVNTRPLFSASLDPRVVERIMETFPEGRTVGPFLIRWKVPEGAEPGDVDEALEMGPE
ncbi:MAG: glycosyltransferase family 39 protein [Gemmatimonadota bacterium]|jgi:hypothetical protein